MKRQTIFLIIVAFLALSGVVFFYNKANHTLVNVPDSVASTTEANSRQWSLYKNTKHGYSLSYPSEATLGSGSETGPISAFSDADEIFFAQDGKAAEYFAVSFLDPTTLMMSGKLVSEELYKADIETFAITFRGSPTTEKPTYASSASPLEEIEVAGTKGMKFTLTSTFWDDEKRDPSRAETYVFVHVLVEKDGKKFLLHFPEGNAISQQIFDSLKFE